MPHVRAPPLPAGSGRGRGRGMAGRQAACRAVPSRAKPVPWLARTGPWESRSLRDIRQSQSSSARVKTCDNVFGECLQHDYSLLFVFLYMFGAMHCWRE
jgi:hypothetical protein